MTEATKRKHVTREVIDNYELPEENQEIVKVIRGCGNNLHEVVTPSGEQYLVSMPTKFRRSIWIKRGDYLVVTPIEEGNKVKAEITRCLMKEQIRYFKEQNIWPKEFDEDQTNSDPTGFLSGNLNYPGEESDGEDEDDEEEDDADDEDEEEESEEEDSEDQDDDEKQEQKGGK